MARQHCHKQAKGVRVKTFVARQRQSRAFLLSFGFWIFVFFFMFHPAQAGSVPVDNFLGRLESYIQEIRTTWQPPAMAVGVVEKGQIKFVKAYGIKKQGESSPVDEHTIFQIASLSKTFASTLAGELADEGKISFDDKLVKYFPDIVLGTPEHTKKVTLGHILSHTTGFAGHAGDSKLNGDESFDNIMDSLSALKVSVEPGRIHSYQNVIYGLSGDMMEKATGDTYAHLVTSHLLEPLQMTDTTLGKDALFANPNRTHPHNYGRNNHSLIDYNTGYYKTLPAAGVNSSITDVTKWLKFHMDKGVMLAPDGNYYQLVSEKNMALIHSPIVKTPAETARMNRGNPLITDTYYGYGWRVYHYNGRPMYMHGGMLRGYRSLLAYLPEEQVGIVILANSTAPVTGILRSWFFDRALGLPEVDYNKITKDKENQTRPIKKKTRRKRR